MSRFFAEFIGTLALVLFGCGAAVLGGEEVGQLGVVGGVALQQLWLFFVAPALGAAVGAVLFRYRLLSTAAKPTVERVDTTAATHA